MLCCVTCYYFENCIPTPLLDNTSLYDKLYGKLHDISSLRVFGCLCYVNSLTANIKKIDGCFVPRIFLGFKPHTKGFIFLNLKNHKIDVSRHVTFL